MCYNVVWYGRLSYYELDFNKIFYILEDYTNGKRKGCN